MSDAPTATPVIRPAMETLRELDGKEFLDKLAIAIHDATVAVQTHKRGARVTISLDIAMLPNQSGLVDPAITIEADIATKLPKPDPTKALFFIDRNGNPTTNMNRQREIGLQIASRDDDAKESNG